MFLEINGIDRNVYMIASIIQDGNKLIYKMQNGAQLQEEFSTEQEATDKYNEAIEKGIGIPLEDGKIPAEYLPSYVDDIVDLIAVDSDAPASCAEGDKYYNTTSKLIYTATGTNTWGDTGVTPEGSKIYLNISANPATSYRWSGTDLVEVGQDLSNYMTLDSAQTVTGIKTFSSLPESSVVPTTNNQLVNKKYVDGKVSQIATLPAAESTNEGRIYQYIGATDSTYTNGYFYKCVSDGANPATYSWSQVNVQPGSSNSILLNFAQDYNSNANALDLDDLKPGVYIMPFDPSKSYSASISVYFAATLNGVKKIGTLFLDLMKTNIFTRNIILYIYKKPSETIAGDFFGSFYVTSGSKTDTYIRGYQYKITHDSYNDNLYINYTGYQEALDLTQYVRTSDNQTISGVKTFNSLPESSVVPTTDNQLVNKKYVDDNAGGSGGGYSNIFSSDVDSLNNDSATKTKLAEFITNNKNKTVFIFVASSSTGNYSTNGAAIFKMYINGIFSNVTYRGVKISGSPYGETYQSGNILDISTLSVIGTWSNNVFTISSVEATVTNQPDCYISTSNAHTLVYTPTQPYNPANKKYVDDTINNKIWIGTQAEYDALGSYSDSTVYFIKENTNAS